MDTKIFEINPDDINYDDIKSAADIIKAGGNVAFPTETVYGLGAGIYHEEALKNIFKAKKRPMDNPLIVHISEKSEMEDIAEEITPCAKILAEKFMPGPITLVMKKKSCISSVISAGLDTVAVRCPAHPIANALIKAAGEPIAAPSANLSKKPSPTEAFHVINDMNGRIEAIISGGSCSAGVESTVVDVTGDFPVILRPGVITYEDLTEVMPKTEIDKHVLKSVDADEIPKSPGMKYLHYSPEADVMVIEGEKESVKAEIDRLLMENKGIKTGVLGYFNKEYDCDVVLSAGNTQEEYAHNLFSMLRRFDELGVEKVFAEFREEGGCGLAVQNRLYKSAGYKVIHV